MASETLIGILFAILSAMVFVLYKTKQLQIKIGENVGRLANLSKYLADKMSVIQQLTNKASMAKQDQERVQTLEDSFNQLLAQLVLQGIVLPQIVFDALLKILEFSQQHSLSGIQGFFVGVRDTEDREGAFLGLLHIQGDVNESLTERAVPDGACLVIHVIVNVTGPCSLKVINHHLT